MVLMGVLDKTIRDIELERENCKGKVLVYKMIPA